MMIALWHVRICNIMIEQAKVVADVHTGVLAVRVLAVLVFPKTAQNLTLGKKR